MSRCAPIWLIAGALWAMLPVAARAQTNDQDDLDDIASEDLPTHHSWLEQYKAEFWDDVHRMKRDFRHMYTGKHLACLGLTVAAMHPIANTHADQGIRDWYQHHVKRPGYQDWTDVGNKFGEWQFTIPIYLGAWAAGSLFDERPGLSVVGQWGERTMRGLAVGGPASSLLQIGLGGSRPEEGRSHWHPFQDTNSVAGHGFVGAVPFLTAASMTRHRPLKALLFAGSFYTTWARLDDDSHYFSQCVLGWTIAYLATRSVNMTEWEMQRVQFTPLAMPQGGAGLGVLIRF